MNIKTLNEKYKEKFRALAEQLGRAPTSDDPEYWELTEWYKDNVDLTPKEKVDSDTEPMYHKPKPAPKSVIEPVVRKPKPIAVPKVVTTAAGPIATTIICRDCGVEFPRPIQRGRPPVKCEPCRSK